MVLNSERKKDIENILEVVLKDRKKDQFYVELFCSSIGSMELVEGNRIGFDMFTYPIHFYYWLQEMPSIKKVYRKMYWVLKKHKTNFNPAIIFHFGTLLSEDNEFFSEIVSEEDEIKILKLIENSIEKLRGVEFYLSAFTKVVRHLPLSDRCIIYCDLVYRLKLDKVLRFRVDEFYDWAKVMSELGHKVFILDTEVRDGFEVLYETNHKRNGETAKLIRYELESK